MNFYNFHIQDFRSRAWHLSNVHAFAYRLLIDEYYLNEKPLDGDIELLAHKIRYRTDEELKALREVLAEFFVLKKGKYHHSRIDGEIKNYQYRRNKPAMMKRLGELGVEFDKGMSVAELASLLAMYDGDLCNVATGNATDATLATLDATLATQHATAMQRECNANTQRSQRHRQRQKLLKQLHDEFGLIADKSMSLQDLQDLYHAKTGNVATDNATLDATDATPDATLCNGKNHAITNNQELITTATAITREEKNFSQPENPFDLPTPFDRFAMHGDWQPADLGMVNALLRRAALPSCETVLILDAALDFVAYWAGRPDVEHTAAQWDSEFVRSAVKYRAKHGHRYDSTTWELKQIAPSTSTALAVPSAPNANAPSKTKQSVMILSAVREKVLSGSLKTVLSPKICLALVDGLLDLLGAGLKYPPAADAWEFTLNAWANDFVRYKLSDDDVPRVQTAFAHAKRNALNGENKGFPTVAEVLACLPMRLVPKIEHKLSPEEWAKKAAHGRSKTAELLKNIGKNRIQAA